MTFLPNYETLNSLSKQYSDQEIGRMFGVSYTRVWEVRKKLGIPSFYQRNGIKKDPKTGELTHGGKNLIKFDERYFQSIDTEHKAYFLGFISADGHIRKNLQCCQISIQLQDKLLLVKLTTALGLDESRIKHRIHKSKHEMVELYLSSRFMCEDLFSIGLTHNKSFDLKINSGKIPDHLLNHFVRGYSDGNGSFYEGKNLRIYTASKEFSNQLMNWLSVPNSTPVLRVDKNTRKNPLYVIYLSHKAAMNSIDWIYQNQTICLDRKFTQFSRFTS